MNNRKILIIFMLLIGIFATTGCINKGYGTAVDTVYDVSTEGFVWKVPIVYLTNDHPSAGAAGHGYSAKYTFDPSNTDLRKSLEEARDSRKTVKIYYSNEMFFFPPWKYPSDAVGLIYKVEYINTTPK
jgi:hypothetical protein